MVQNLIPLYVEGSKKKLAEYSQLLGRSTFLTSSMMPAIMCIAFGTLFYGCYPGEDKSVFEGFYMSIITLMTIGFGAYTPITEVGQAVGSVWMVVGVVCTGIFMVDVSAMMYQS